MAAPAATTNAVRWGADQRNHLTAAFESYKADATQGYSYRLQDLTADYLRHCWQHDVLSIKQIVAHSIATIETGLRDFEQHKNDKGFVVLRLSVNRHHVRICCCCHCHCYQIIMFDSYF